MWQNRAVAPVLGVVLLVATTVVASGAVALVALAPTDGTVDEAEGIEGVVARFAVDAVDADERRVAVRYVAGPSLDVSDLAIVVRAGDRTGRLVGLPAGRDERCYGDPDDVLGEENVANDTIFSRACGATSGPITAKASDGVWRPGETARFTLKVPDGGGPSLESGDAVAVTVVDVDRGGVVATTAGEIR